MLSIYVPAKRIPDPTPSSADDDDHPRWAIIQTILSPEQAIISRSVSLLPFRSHILEDYYSLYFNIVVLHRRRLFPFTRTE